METENLNGSDVIADPSFGEWLRGERARREWAQQELAGKAGISQPHVANLESGRSGNPRPGTVRKLEAALGINVPDLVARDTEEAAEIVGLGALVDFDPYDPDLPDVAGVYVFYDISDRPIYVGRSSRGTIAGRVRNHNEKFWFKRPIVNNAAYIQIDDEALCVQLEQVLIKFLKSNAVLNKQLVNR